MKEIQNPDKLKVVSYVRWPPHFSSMPDLSALWRSSSETIILNQSDKEMHTSCCRESTDLLQHFLYLLLHRRNFARIRTAMEHVLQVIEVYNRNNDCHLPFAVLLQFHKVVHPYRKLVTAERQHLLRNFVGICPVRTIFLGQVVLCSHMIYLNIVTRNPTITNT